MTVKVELSGIYPRSEFLIEKTRQYERGRATIEEVRNQIDVDTRSLIELQQQAEFTTFSDGALFWQDQIRPLTTCFQGVQAESRYSRWFDTNSFYQKPVINGKISLHKFEPKTFISSTFLPRNKDWKVSIIGPYSFSQLAENQFYASFNDLVLDVAAAECDLLTELHRNGATAIQLAEPCLVYQPYREQFATSQEISVGLDAIARTVQDTTEHCTVQTYFGDASPIISDLLTMNIAGIGIDVFETEFSKLNLETSKTIELGIVDSRDSNVEDSKWIIAKTREVSKKVHSDHIVLSSNTDLKFVPGNIAAEKIASLTKARDQLKEFN